MWPFRKRTPEQVARARETDFRTVVIILLLCITVNSCTIDSKLGDISKAVPTRPPISFQR